MGLLFAIPIPAKVVDGVTDGATNLYKSYKKPAPASSLGADGNAEAGASDEKAPLPPPAAPPARRGNSYAYGSNPPVPRRSTTGPAPPAYNYATNAKSPIGSAGAGTRSEEKDAFGMQLLSHTLDSIALLETMGVITPAVAGNVRAQLEQGQEMGGTEKEAVKRYAEALHDRPSVPPPTRKASTGPASPQAQGQIRATALWDYGTDADDLVFAAGDTIIIDEDVNADWCRGRTIPKGSVVPRPKKGLFPSNYVEPH